MSLNDLPAELTDLIVSYLVLLESPDYEPSTDSPRTKPKIGKYACASMNLQYAVEKHMFRHLILDAQDLHFFAPLIAISKRRRAILRSVMLVPELPDPNQHTCGSESSCQQANDRDFSVVIQNLYTALYFCGEVEGKLPLRLILAPPRETINEDGPYLHLWKHSRLQFGTRTYLNPSDRVTQFMCFADSDGEAYVTPGSILNLLKGIPKVEEVILNIEDDKMNVPSLWTELRMDFARRLRRIELPALTCLHLRYPYQAPLDERFVYSPARRTGGRSAAAQDALSTSFHRLIAACPNLKTAFLSGPACFDESLFWPHNSKPNEARWPNLESLYVEMSAVRPDGGWYLDSQPDVPLDEPENLFDDSDGEFAESTPNPFDDPEYFDALTTGNAYKLACRSQPNESLERVLHAAARAAKTMPSLRSMCFTMRVDACPRTDYQPEKVGFVYGVKGNTLGEVHMPYSEMLWVGPREWKTSKSLEEVWREVLGTEAEMHYQGW